MSKADWDVIQHMLSLYTGISAEDIESATGELAGWGAPYQAARFPLSPTILPWQLAEHMERLCQRVFRATELIFDRYFHGDPARIGEFLRLPTREVGLWPCRPDHDWALMARPDIVMSRGHMYVVDFNATSCAGLFATADAIVRAHGRIAALRQWLRYAGAVPTNCTAGFADLLRTEWRSVRDGVVVTAEWMRDIGYYQPCLANELRSLGLPAIGAPVESLDISDCGVKFDGRRVAVLHRSFSAPDPGDGMRMESFHRILDLQQDPQRLAMVSGFRGESFHSEKACLALLSDERFTYVLPSRYAELSRRVVPWTRVLEERRTTIPDGVVDLLPWTSRNKDRLLIKPSRGYGGHGIVVGREVDELTWTQTLETALRDEDVWVVQELLQSDTSAVLLRHDGEVVAKELPTVYGPFMVRRRLTGAIRRYGGNESTININATSGAVVSPIYWIGRR